MICDHAKTCGDCWTTQAMDRVRERAEKAEARVAELEARDANGLPTHCVDRATWDEMGRELAAAANERDEALARVAELEAVLTGKWIDGATAMYWIARDCISGTDDFAAQDRMLVALEMRWREITADSVSDAKGGST
jgi:BMFP domain-containing protein YqiC